MLRRVYAAENIRLTITVGYLCKTKVLPGNAQW